MREKNRKKQLESIRASISMEARPVIKSEFSVSCVLASLAKTDFAGFTLAEHKVKEPLRLSKNEQVVLLIDLIKKEMGAQALYVAKNSSEILYFYNSAYWEPLDTDSFKKFLTEGAQTLGVPFEKVNHFDYKKDLLRQFEDRCPVLKEPENGEIKINLMNGTLIISNGKYHLRPFQKEDYFTYQLAFGYNPEATCAQFQKFLDEVLPEKESQMILSEFFGSAFISNKVLKTEKALLLYGTGANGKSVVYEIMKDLFGKENFSSFSLDSLTDEGGAYRAKVEGKLINYASEITGVKNTGKLKQLISGESIDVRPLYKNPFTIDRLPRLVFNINEFPKNSEKTDAFYRRLITVPFNKRIPEHQQDKTLAQRISDTELSGILNWILTGMDRLMQNQKFTESANANELLGRFKTETDAVAAFCEAQGLRQDLEKTIPLKELYSDFGEFCKENGFMKSNIQTFSTRLANLGFQSKKSNKGKVIYAIRNQGGDDSDEQKH